MNKGEAILMIYLSAFVLTGVIITVDTYIDDIKHWIHEVWKCIIPFRKQKVVKKEDVDCMMIVIIALIPHIA